MTVKLPSALFAFGSLSLAVLAQETVPAPIEPPVVPPVAPSAVVPAPVVDQPPISPDVPLTPAPIEPPIAVPTSPALPGTPGAVSVVPGMVDPTLGGPVGLAPGTTRVNEFQGDPIDLVLRTLAKQARINLVISDKVTAAGGTVTMRLEDKSPKEAIEIIAQSKGLIMDEVNGVYFVKTQEEKAKEPTESASFTLSYAKAADIMPLLQTQLQSGVPPQFDVRTNTVFYREGKSNLDKIQEFLIAIDQPTQQVMIEARLVEVTANPRQSYGINWSGVVGGSATAKTFRYGGTLPDVDGSQTLEFQNGQATLNDFVQVGGNARRGAAPDGGPAENLNPLTGLSTGFANSFGNQLAILSIPQMSLTTRLLNEDSDAEFLANPRIVTANNQKAEIKITRNQPVPQLNFNEQTAQAVFSGFQDKEFGNTLTVTPIINKDQFITLNVKPEISNKVGDATFTFSGAVVTSPVIDKRVLESNVLIKSGDTLAIGGLLQDEQTKASSKVPVLGDIPILGYLFQEKLNQRNKRNLLVFVTPTVIKQGYGTGLESQVGGLTHTGEEYADPNGWRNNAKGAVRLVPTSHRQLAADIPKPGVPAAPRKVGYKVRASNRE